MAQNGYSVSKIENGKYTLSHLDNVIATIERNKEKVWEGYFLDDNKFHTSVSTPTKNESVNWLIEKYELEIRKYT